MTMSTMTPDAQREMRLKHARVCVEVLLAIGQPVTNTLKDVSFKYFMDMLGHVHAETGPVLPAAGGTYNRLVTQVVSKV